MQYFVLPGKNPPTNFIEVYDQIFKFWEESWSAFFKSMDPSAGVRPDDFLRQDYLTALFDGRDVAGILFASAFDLRTLPSLRHSYLQYHFNGEFFTSLKKQGIHKILTMESLFVGPKYRSRQRSESLSEILISLGQRLFAEETNCDALIAPARSDIGVSSYTQKVGYRVQQQGIVLHGTPVDLLFCQLQDIQKPESRDRQDRLNDLWLHRNASLDYSIENIKTA